MPTSRNPRVCVLAPAPILTVTLESGSDDGAPERHVHPGGQRLWVARMAYSLGADVVVCGPFGGETGTVLGHLAEVENLRVRRVSYAGGNGAYLHDRRGAERTELAFMPPAHLDRHELDDLDATMLVEGLDVDVYVITGAYPTPLLPTSFLGRLVGDLRAAGVRTVADLSGRAAAEVARAGADVLTMSHEELVEAGMAADGSVRSVRSLRAGAQRLLRAAEPGPLAGRAVGRAGGRADDTPDPDAAGGDAAGGDTAGGDTAGDASPAGSVGAMVVSRAAYPALVVTASGVAEVVAPSVTTVDHRGAGDSMTAGLVVGVGRGLRRTEAARLGSAAGALDVTRRGLGTGHREQIERFAEQITVREVA